MAGTSDRSRSLNGINARGRTDHKPQIERVSAICPGLRTSVPGEQSSTPSAHRRRPAAPKDLTPVKTGQIVNGADGPHLRLAGKPAC